ncbi:TPA: hypothetical protein QDB45_001624 [Burkholderia vietnamiensis]|nr:hypothetical protein [Burkholderia vietnamiensis]
MAFSNHSPMFRDLMDTTRRPRLIEYDEVTLPQATRMLKMGSTAETIRYLRTKGIASRRMAMLDHLDGSAPERVYKRDDIENLMFYVEMDKKAKAEGEIAQQTANMLIANLASKAARDAERLLDQRRNGDDESDPVTAESVAKRMAEQRRTVTRELVGRLAKRNITLSSERLGTLVNSTLEKLEKATAVEREKLQTPYVMREEAEQILREGMGQAMFDKVAHDVFSDEDRLESYTDPDGIVWYARDDVFKILPRTRAEQVREEMRDVVNRFTQRAEQARHWLASRGALCAA